MENTEEVYLRSSNRTRTIESLQQVIHGLFPLDKQGQFFVPHICVRLVLIILPYWSTGTTNATRNKRDENLYPNTSACQRLNTLMEEFAKGVICTSRTKVLILTTASGCGFDESYVGASGSEDFEVHRWQSY